MATNDPMQAAIEPTTYSNEMYGKVEVSAKFVYTAKGERPRDFEPGDDPKRRSTEISLSLTTIDAMGLTRPVIEKHHLSWTPAWEGVWQSIKALGCEDLYGVNGKYVKVEMVPTGRKYTNKEGKEREETAMKFVALYDTEAACVKAYESEQGVSPESTPDKAGEWRPILETLVEVANGDMAMLAKRLTKSGSPFGIDSDLVKSILMATAEAA